jgi:hypothetical protein
VSTETAAAVEFKGCPHLLQKLGLALAKEILVPQL